jgi:hypothetical protein
MTTRMKIMALAHPILFALIPVLSLLSHNIQEISPSYAIRAALLVLAAAGAVLWIFNRVLKDLNRAAVSTSMTLALFFSYGHVLGGFLGAGPRALFERFGLIGQQGALTLVWLALWALCLWALGRLSRWLPLGNTMFVMMAFGALAIPAYNMIRNEILLRQPWPAEAWPPAAELRAGPDIYYIVLDGYARADVLAEVYGYDNSPFLEFLEHEGFTVAGDARSNYPQTALSIASSLNMDYLDDVAAQVGVDSNDRLPLARLIRWSEVRQTLQERGYRVVNLASGYRMTELENADQFLSPPLTRTTTFDRLMIETSGLIALQGLATSLGVEIPPVGYEAHRERILFALDRLVTVAAEPGPKFVFAHIIAPHPPFVFGSEGQPIQNRRPFTLMDGDAFTGTRQEYITGYTDQLTYINSRMENVIRRILLSSETPPVIVIQADHGPGLGLVWSSAKETDLTERLAILNVYYLPGEAPAQVNGSITPVNTFRLIFQRYFGLDYPLLPDRSSFATWNQPYEFIPLQEQAGRLVVAP